MEFLVIIKELFEVARKEALWVFVHSSISH